MEDQFEPHGVLGTQADAQLTARYARYAERRKEGAVAWEPTLDAWCVYRYAEVRRVCTDEESFSPPGAGRREGPHLGAADADPARHATLRRVLAKAFAPGAVAKLEPRVQAITRELLAPALTRGHFDVVSDIAHPLPVIVVAELLGVPASERARYRRWADAILADEGTGHLRGLPPTAEARAARAELDAWLNEECRRPGRADRDDLLAALLSGRADGEPLSREELLSFCSLLLVAGHATTVHLIANAVYCLVRFPEAREAVTRDRALLPDAVEEALRYLGPAQEVVRVAAKPVRLGGTDIAAGQRVVAWIAAANRDERVFVEPDRFDARRRPNPHLSFGAGVHACLGAPLARLQARVALDELLYPLGYLRPSDEDPPRLETGCALLGFSRFVLERA